MVRGGATLTSPAPKAQEEAEAQRQATFLDKPKEALKNGSTAGTSGAGHAFFVRISRASTWARAAREQVEVITSRCTLENQLTGGEWHPCALRNTVTSEDWLSWASLLLVFATFPRKPPREELFQIKHSAVPSIRRTRARCPSLHGLSVRSAACRRLGGAQLRMKMNSGAPSRSNSCPAAKSTTCARTRGRLCRPRRPRRRDADSMVSHGEEKNKRKRTLAQTAARRGSRPTNSIKYGRPTTLLKDLFSAYWSIGTQENYAYGGHTIYLDSYNPAEEFQSLSTSRGFDRKLEEKYGRCALYAPMLIFLALSSWVRSSPPTGDLVPEACLMTLGDRASGVSHGHAREPVVHAESSHLVRLCTVQVNI